MIAERAQQIERYKATSGVFDDYKHFEGEAAARLDQRNRFINGEIYTPDYEYDQLDELSANSDFQALKTEIYEAVLGLEAAKNEPGADVAELTIYSDYYALRLHKIMLVEAARHVTNASTSGEWEVAAQSFGQLNREVYGEYNTEKFSLMMNTERGKLDDFQPSTTRAASIKEELGKALSHVSYDETKQEKPLMSDEELQVLHEVILERYAGVLEAVPDTGDDVYYDADQVVAIMNDALERGGLAEAGWEAVIHPKKANPATNVDERRIFLPPSTRRNANELKRLIVHEQEVHARRGENGYNTGFEPLRNGTADYADVEEGLGVVLECAIAGSWDNPSFHRARDRYIVAGLALGADGTPRDARSVYETLWRVLAIRNSQDGDISDEAIANAQKLAYTHVDNAYRGTEFWMRGVIYSKLKVYHEGLEKNTEFLPRTPDAINEALDRATIGKYDHTSEAEYENVTSVLDGRRNSSS
jgi:hypothetical protein